MILAQAAAEYIGIVAHQGLAVLQTVAGKTIAFITTPKGVIVAAGVAIFLAFSLGWRRPPRM